ncbi:MAG: glycosyltransferase [Dehalococcoidia bacterium]|nr:glycosyltransferase [Dehalococcoidia bacterium]
MKIGLVSPYDLAVPGGVNSHIHHLAENFTALGHEVRLIAPSSDISKLGPNSIAIGRPRSIPAGGSIARMAISPRLAQPVRRILAEEAFDVVHVHEPLVSFLPIQFLRFSNAVNVGTFHAARESGARLYIYTRRLLSHSFRRLDGKIAVSRAAAGLIAPHFPGYYNIIPNGVDVERFSAPAEPLTRLNDGKVNILFVGRLEKRKGLSYLLRAFAQVKAARPDTRLLIVGGYDARQKRGYERWVKESGLPDVEFVGVVSNEELPRYHHSAQIFCAPNTGNESQGIILLEAMAAGCPVVASNIDGFADVLTHGVEGLLVRPKDADALAGALLDLVDNPSLRSAMGARGSERAQYFSWEQVSQRVLSYYERLMYEKLDIPSHRETKLVEAS